MIEDLNNSLIVSHKFIRIVSMVREFCHESIENNPNLNDEVLIALASLTNGMNSVGEQFDKASAIIMERKTIFGEFGHEKRIKIVFTEYEDDEVALPLDFEDEDQNARDCTEFLRRNLEDED